jgi:hypothetical protein
MQTITITAVIGEDHRLVIDLPEDSPTGLVELTIRPTQPRTKPLTREEARDILRKAGVLVEDIEVAADTERLSPDELLELGRLAPGARSSLDLINEDRGEW